MISYGVQWLSDNPTTAGQWYMTIARWVFPVLALAILVSVLIRMLKVKNPGETWAYLMNDQLGSFPIQHWECTVGRARHCDVQINFPTVSRTQCSLIRDDQGVWTVYSLSDKNPTYCDGVPVAGSMVVKPGSIVSFGGVELELSPISEIEREIIEKNRLEQSKPAPPWGSFALLSLFQFFACMYLMLTRPEHTFDIMLCFGTLLAVMWTYVLGMKAARCNGFEPEILAFFACSLNLGITATSAPDTLYKETFTVLLGIIFFLCLGIYLRDLRRVVKSRYAMAALTCLLLAVNILFGASKNGAQNWIIIAGISVQPSEIAKVLFIFAGSATLDRLFVKRNLGGFMLLSAFCLGSLAIMSDFGTAAIFFVVFLVIAYLRSGDFATLSLICGGAVGAGLLALRFKPYIASRFSVWGHAWENATGTGFQQVRTMSASASGGLIGVGPGEGWLHHVAASNTDLVFGLVCEEWGLIIALLSVASIVTLSIFAFRVTKTGRSAFYTTAACAATSLLVFQTMLNVFGSVDLFPLTGVTFPFVSCGGSSMVASWGLLAYLKAADTRQGASFAVKRLPLLGDEEDEEEFEDEYEGQLEGEYQEGSPLDGVKRKKFRAASRATMEYQVPEEVAESAAESEPVAGSFESVAADYSSGKDDYHSGGMDMDSWLDANLESQQTDSQHYNLDREHDEIDDFLSQFDSLEENLESHADRVDFRTFDRSHYEGGSDR